MKQTVKDRPLIEQLGGRSVSPYRQYLQMFVGRESLWELLRYELLVSGTSWVPGALGYFLRSKCFPRVLRRAGHGCLFGYGVVLRSPGRISLGSGVVLDDQVVLDGKGPDSTIELGDQILLGRGCVVSCNNARIRFGDFVSIAPYCTFITKSFIEIGSNVSIGNGAYIMAAGHAIDDPELPAIRQRRTSEGIRIGDNVWLGAGSLVTDGSAIGEGSVIGAGALVRGEIPPNSVAAGVPARVLYDRRERGREVEETTSS